VVPGKKNMGVAPGVRKPRLPVSVNDMLGRPYLSSTYIGLRGEDITIIASWSQIDTLSIYSLLE
jgi:hypothetical protein